jgi:hypothetical protein
MAYKATRATLGHGSRALVSRQTQQLSMARQAKEKSGDFYLEKSKRKRVLQTLPRKSSAPLFSGHITFFLGIVQVRAY